MADRKSTCGSRQRLKAKSIWKFSDATVSVYQSQLHLNFAKAEAVEYTHRLDLLPGSYRLLFSVDGTTYPYLLDVPSGALQSGRHLTRRITADTPERKVEHHSDLRARNWISMRMERSPPSRRPRPESPGEFDRAWRWSGNRFPRATGRLPLSSFPSANDSAPSTYVALEARYRDRCAQYRVVIRPETRLADSRGGNSALFQRQSRARAALRLRRPSVAPAQSKFDRGATKPSVDSLAN